MGEIIDLRKLIPAWRELRSLIPIAHIDNDQDYEQMTELLNALLDVVRDDSQHPLYSLTSIVGDLIETYEADDAPSM